MQVSLKSANILENYSEAQLQLLSIAEELTKFQNYFHEVEIDNMYIIGGAARSILDAYYYDEVLSIRDLDTALVLGHEASEDEIWSLAAKTQAWGLGVNISPELRKKNWAHPEDNPQFWGKKNYGFGFHLRTKNIPIVSLSFYFTDHALKMLGLFTFDTTIIRIPFGKNLIETLESEDCIIDPMNGYSNWRQKRPIFFKNIELKRDPIKASFRIIRSYAKLNSFTLPQDLLQTMKSEISFSSQVDIDEFEYTRCILKVLNDKHCSWEMEQLLSTGLLELYPAIKQKLKQGNFYQWVNATYPFLDVKNP